MNTNLKDRIASLQIDLYKRIDSFLELCNNPDIFDIGNFPLFNVLEDFIQLSEYVEKYNLAAKFKKSNPIENPFQELCNKLSNTPNMDDLFREHLNRAKNLESNYRKISSKFNSFTREERDQFIDSEMEQYHKAIGFIQDSTKQKHYKEIADKLDEIQKAYCTISVADQKAKNTLKVKTKYVGPDSENIESFCQALEKEGYFDRENADKFRKVLENGQLPSRIDWLKKRADVCRLINSMKSEGLFVSRPNWQSFESTFHFDGSPAKNLKSAATSKTSDINSEKIVIQSFKLK